MTYPHRIETTLDIEAICFHEPDKAAEMIFGMSAEIVRLHEALERIADERCDCTGYDRCGTCPERIVSIAEAALGVPASTRKDGGG